MSNFTEIVDGTLATPANLNAPLQSLSDAIDSLSSFGRFGVEGEGSFDTSGTYRLRVDSAYSTVSPDTPGGTNHLLVGSLRATDAHDAPNVAVVGALRTEHSTGTLTAGQTAVEGFVEAAGDGGSTDLYALRGAITMFGGHNGTNAAGVHANVNANGAWSGSLGTAYGLYVADLAAGTNKYALWTEGAHPSRFGGPAQFAAPVNDQVVLNRASGAGLVRFNEDDVRHFALGRDGSAADDFALFRYSDAGTFLGTSMLVDRDEGHVILEAPASAPVSASMENGTVAFWVDEPNNQLEIQVKYADGTLKSASVALT